MSTIAKGERLGFRALGEKIVVLPDPKEDRHGDILIPDTVKEVPRRGEVVSVGPGRALENGEIVAAGLTPGQRVLYGRYSGTEVRIDAVDYIVLNPDDILVAFD